MYQIKNRLTGASMFECELGAELETAYNYIKLGAAVKLALKAGANLMDADLAGADLAGADLAGAYLAGADLARANLAGTNLMDADLAGADLAGADLAGADLARANLAGTNLAGTNLMDAKDIIDAGTPNGWRAVGWRRDGVLRVRVGCHNFSITPGRVYWHAKADRREVMAALDYIEAVARLREWPEAV